MATYLVHAPRNATGDLDASRRVTFIKDGFSLAAFVATPIWLIARRLWLATFVWLVISAALVGTAVFHVISWGVAACGYSLLALFFGTESGALRSAKTKRERVLQDVVCGTRADAAMRAYFARRLDLPHVEQVDGWKEARS